jgi:N-acetylmuramoyl-L-alanine amidase
MGFSRSILTSASSRYGFPLGSTGRGNALTPKAICLSFAGLSAPEYLQSVREPLPVKLLQQRLGFPHSVHYLIREDGVIYRLVEEHNAAWGVLIPNNPTWTVVPDLQENVDESLLHVAFEGKQVSKNAQKAAIELCADIAKRWGIPVDSNHIVSRFLLDEASEMTNLPEGFIASVISESNLQISDVMSMDQVFAYVKSLESRISSLEGA